jgi:hypothetical protein
MGAETGFPLRGGSRTAEDEGREILDDAQAARRKRRGMLPGRQSAHERDQALDRRHHRGGWLLLGTRNPKRRRGREHQGNARRRAQPSAPGNVLVQIYSSDNSPCPISDHRWSSPGCACKDAALTVA